MAMLLLARCCWGPGQIPRGSGLPFVAASARPATQSPVPINFWLLIAGDAPPPPADISLCAACCEHHRARDVAKLTEALAALASRRMSVEVDDGDGRAFLLPGRKQVKVRESSFVVGGLGYSVWNAGIALSIWLAYQPERVRGQRVLELGSGVGLAGISAGLLGAEEVTLTDVANLDILEDNARLNGLEQTVQTVHLDWNVCCDDAFAPAAHGLRTYPLVIGSDVITMNTQLARSLQQW
ncbi:hypothetical protein AB1Y20_017419 [Prymnesium parvum]|uniref:Calmodulin-lysine N-methyltransferase n=1 Tax=Prymnesium parvum TaxID=97485 RepID=A0AB34JPB2_PRYPA